MSVLQNVETALNKVGFAIGKGKYPDTTEDCGKIVFSGEDKPIRFMGGHGVDVETFKVIVRGSDYAALEQKVNAVKSALRNAGFGQIGGLEDIEAKEGETFLQIAIGFKALLKIIKE